MTGRRERHEAILAAIDVGLQDSAELAYGETDRLRHEGAEIPAAPTCVRCDGPLEDDDQATCPACRAFLLGDTDVDPIQQVSPAPYGVCRCLGCCLSRAVERAGFLVCSAADDGGFTVSYSVGFDEPMSTVEEAEQLAARALSRFVRDGEVFLLVTDLQTFEVVEPGDVEAVETSAYRYARQTPAHLRASRWRDAIHRIAVGDICGCPSCRIRRQSEGTEPGFATSGPIDLGLTRESPELARRNDYSIFREEFTGLLSIEGLPTGDGA